MYCGHARLCVCVCLSVSLSACPRPHARTIARTVRAIVWACGRGQTDREPDVTWGSGRGCPLVVQYCADLQSGHELRCNGNITRTRNVSEYMLVLAVCLVDAVTFRASRRRR